MSEENKKIAHDIVYDSQYFNHNFKRNNELEKNIKIYLDAKDSSIKDLEQRLRERDAEIEKFYTSSKPTLLQKLHDLEKREHIPGCYEVYGDCTCKDLHEKITQDLKQEALTHLKYLSDANKQLAEKEAANVVLKNVMEKNLKQKNNRNAHCASLSAEVVSLTQRLESVAREKEESIKRIQRMHEQAEKEVVSLEAEIAELKKQIADSKGFSCPRCQYYQLETSGIKSVCDFLSQKLEESEKLYKQVSDQRLRTFDKLHDVEQKLEKAADLLRDVYHLAKASEWSEELGTMKDVKRLIAEIEKEGGK